MAGNRLWDTLFGAGLYAEPAQTADVGIGPEMDDGRRVDLGAGRCHMGAHAPLKPGWLLPARGPPKGPY